MKKRVLSFVIALLMFVMLPAETVMAMPTIPAEKIITLTEGEEEIVDDVAISEEAVDEAVETEIEDTETPVLEPEVETTEEPTAEPEVEATEEPVLEPEVETTEEPEAEPTSEVVVEPTMEATETPTAEPEASLIPEMTPDVEETVEPTSEATEEPTAEVTEEFEEEEIAEVVATPTVEPSTTPVVKDVIAEGRDLTAKVVGTNGIQYEGVAYLSLQTVSNLPDDVAEAYVEMCDVVASWVESGVGYEDIVISVDKEGNLKLGASVPHAIIYSEEIQEQFLVDEDDNADAAVETVEASEQVEDVVEETDVLSNDSAAEDVVEDEITEESDENIVAETVQEVENNKAEEVSGEEPEKETVAAEKSDVILPENVSLETSYEIKEETVLVEDTVSLEKEEFDTLITNTSHFKNQLTSREKAIYNAAKSSIVSKGKNKFSYNTDFSGYLSLSNNNFLDFANAISALVNTYPNKFDWMDKTGSDRLAVYRYVYTGKYRVDYTIAKSKWYSSSLEKSAKSKVNQLVKDAKKYASEKYPKNPVYGIIAYFDKWICDNNYYDDFYGTNPKDYGKTKQYYYCHSCYGILLKGYGVCESYALAMSRLLDAAGIRNMYVLGYKNSAENGHAWNYVQMPDGKWYLLDSTWNDDTGTKNWLLCKNDGALHTATGRVYNAGKKFTYTTVQASNYNSGYEESFVGKITLSKSTTNPVYLKTGAKHQLKVNLPDTNNYYFSKYAKAWKSDNTKVAKVDKNGKITAGKTAGKATISYTVAGQTKSCTVYVYKFTGLTFDNNNNKTSFSETRGISKTATSHKDITQKITVKQSNRQVSAATIKSGASLGNPTVTSSNKKVAEATVSAVDSSDKITLTVKPKNVGSTKITVKFGGKTATYKLTIKYNMEEKWLDCSEIKGQTYSGKAYKPKVTKTKVTNVAVPKDFKFAVSYKNNTNAGTATVTIKGTGNYTGTITKNFTIAQQDISKTAQFKSCTKFKTYNGKAQKASTVVKVGKKTLKAGKDYDVQYYYNKAWTTTAPTNKNVYSVRVVGKNNYKGVLAAPNAFEIKQIAIGKVTVSCAKTVKWKKGTPVTAPVKVKIGKNVLTKNADYVVTYYKVVGTTKTKVADNALKDKAKYEAVITPKGSNINWGTKTQIVKTFTIK